MRKALLFLCGMLLPFAMFAQDSTVADSSADLGLIDTTSAPALAPGTFEDANALYTDGEFSRALEIYHALESTGQSPELYYNIGNAYFKSEQLAPAILYYEKALKLNPADEDIRHNLKFVNQNLTDDIGKRIESDSQDAFLGFLYAQKPNFWVWASAMAIGAFFIFLSISLVMKKGRGIPVALGVLCMLGGIGTGAFAIANNSWHSTQDQAIVMNFAVTVMSAPGDTGKEVFKLHEGTKVDLKQAQDGWYEITLPNGKTGWIQEEELGVI